MKTKILSEKSSLMSASDKSFEKVDETYTPKRVYLRAHLRQISTIG